MKYVDRALPRMTLSSKVVSQPTQWRLVDEPTQTYVVHETLDPKSIHFDLPGQKNNRILMQTLQDDHGPHLICKIKFISIFK